ncbi:hypothetical protein GQ54DRAFT_132275 [Martensiomyces pterosporus]|nr:hypothetical protein GQ54DRAFT_132275 [Martensiomyces pterosporus]
MEPMNDRIPVHVIFRYPYKRPQEFQPPQVKPFEEVSLEEQVWRWLLAVPGPDRPLDILAELEEDEVTFDWELLASTLHVPLADVFAAASTLFERHMGRRLTLVEDSSLQVAEPPVKPEEPAKEQRGDTGASAEACQQPQPSLPSLPSSPSSSSMDRPANASDFERTGLQSVESLGSRHESDGPASPVVELSTTTPEAGRSRDRIDEHATGAADSDRSMKTASILTEKLSRGKQSTRSDTAAMHQHAHQWQPLHDQAASQHELDMRQSLIAEAMVSEVHHATASHPSSAAGPPGDEKRAASSSSSFSDLSNSSLTESAMQDALISEAMNGSTAMSSLLGSRMFPWAKKKK